MPTLYHSPFSRSDTIVTLIDLLGARDDVEIQEVTVLRRDGTGVADPRNPHPEGKVPYLTHGNEHIRERGAIILWLTDRYPDAGLGRAVGDVQRGAYLSWLFWYQGVLEPVLILADIGVLHPALEASFRDLPTALDRLEEGLAGQPFLLGARVSAADLLTASPFAMLPEMLEGRPVLQDWVARCDAVRPNIT